MAQFSKYINKTPYRIPGFSGYDWIIRTLGSKTQCYRMFRMHKDVFDSLHNILSHRYGLASTRRMTSVETLAIFLWMCGGQQSMRQADNRFERSLETINRKFNKVLGCVVRLAADIIKPRDPQVRTVHQRLRAARFAPYFDNCIGAIDGTHVPVTVPTDKVIQYTGRKTYTSQNVLAICDFDMRFTFVVAGWPGSVHDMRVFKDAVDKFKETFPFPPQGKFYLVDSGFPNSPGYLAPFRGMVPEWHDAPAPQGKHEVFNFHHASLRNVIERSFGVLKMKWRILLDLASFPEEKQSKIIMACMALHNFH